MSPSRKAALPIYGAGLWGPVWGYVAFEKGSATIKGAYFDHESETAGLGAKIKDDPAFQASFVGKKAAFDQAQVFQIVKGAEGTLADNQIDAITGATMTSQGLDAAINTWFAAYAKFFLNNAPKQDCCGGEGCEGEHENCENHEETEE